MPAPIVDKLNREVSRIMALPEIKEKMLSLGFESMPMGVTDSPAYVAKQLNAYKNMVEAAGAKAE
jgi:tripartite-type tricarboxylate transporter receptor subunit TctC